MAKGPLGNTPRDLRDDFVGVPSELYKGGEPAKKTRNPKKVTSNTFHTTVTGETSNKRPDRVGHFRSGGFVRGKADGGSVGTPTDRSMPSTTSEKYKKGGKTK
jgi:hypothetical protein